MPSTKTATKTKTTTKAKAPKSTNKKSARKRTARQTTATRTGYLTRLGAYGFGNQETVLLAALVTEDPILLIGRSGTGKTFLLNTLSEALGLEHRHYNASLVSFDDLVGFPYPDEAKREVQFLETPATIWNAESVLVDEISRCKPEHQNRFFSLVHERRVQGIALTKLRYRWAAMNPPSTDQGSGGDYLGSEPLDAALADRFSIVLEVGDWSTLSPRDQQRIADPSSEGAVADDGGELAAKVAEWRAEFLEQLPQCPKGIVEYACAATSALVEADIRISPRRSRLLSRTLLAATIIHGDVDEKLFRKVLSVSLPQVAWDEAVPIAKVRAAHKVAWGCSFLAGREKWIHRFHAESRLDRKLGLLATECPDADTGTLVVEQFLAQERKERAAAFAFATFPTAVKGALPIGAEAISDLGRAAQKLFDINADIVWSESHSVKQPTEHPEHSRLGRALSELSGGRGERARQVFYWCLVENVVLDDPAAFEEEFHACVGIARDVLEKHQQSPASCDAEGAS